MSRHPLHCAVSAGALAEVAGETLDVETRRIEGLQLSFCTTSGVPVETLDGDGLDGLVERRDESLGADRSGRLFVNEVAVGLR